MRSGSNGGADTKGNSKHPAKNSHGDNSENGITATRNTMTGSDNNHSDNTTSSDDITPSSPTSRTAAITNEGGDGDDSAEWAHRAPCGWPEAAQAMLQQEYQRLSVGRQVRLKKAFFSFVDFLVENPFPQTHQKPPAQFSTIKPRTTTTAAMTTETAVAVDRDEEKDSSTLNKSKLDY